MRLILTLRSDFFSPCLQYARLAELLNAGLYALSPARIADLYQMIVRPAALAGLRFDDEALVFRILEDTGTAPGALALLASALAELYEGRTPDGTLTHAAYDAFGGVKGVISKRATETYDRLDDAAKGALGDVFKELVEVEPKRGIPTRKRAPQDDFQGMPAALRLIEAFTHRRLLVRSEGSVEVAHEALLTHWEVLSRWIDQRVDDFRLLRRVQLEAADWRSHRGYLWLHERLLPVYSMVERLKPKLTPTERAFIRPESDRLLKRIRNPATPHQERAKIGDRLAEIGDPRPGVGLKNGLPDFVWCKVPAGEITLENSNKTFRVSAFFISKYPVTYVQYRSFLEAKDGFQNKRWWQGLARRQDQPGSQYRQLDNHPAENVSWFDAVAFCCWLSHRFGYEVRLPTEWQWQQAATGGKEHNEYPWGKEWNGECANTWESGLSRTTAVGIYPAGASPVGALDMSGNVWEWCLNEYDNPSRTDPTGDATRVVRGGSWYGLRGFARAAFRFLSNPDARDDGQGFRVVCPSPIA
ncbi:MAG: SUMF1/EgtB/PvdO family nonheme iron enzyme, partial [Gammaproteobacteria bacterium]